MLRDYGDCALQGDKGKWKLITLLQFPQKYFCNSKHNTGYWSLKFSLNNNGNSEF